MQKKTSTQNKTVSIDSTYNTASVSQHLQRQKQPLHLFVCTKAGGWVWVGGQTGGVEGTPQSIHHRGESFNAWHRFCPQDNCQGLLFYFYFNQQQNVRCVEMKVFDPNGKKG